MKDFFFSLVFILIWNSILAQELPTTPAGGFAFPIGSKFTIKLYPTDSVNYIYSVIGFDQFHQTVDTWSHDDLFAKDGQDSTITFYFCFGTHGDSEKEKKENTKVLLLFKNYSKVALTYLSDIKRKEDGDFEPTSNVGSFPGATGTEMWPYMIYMIGLRDFKKHEK